MIQRIKTKKQMARALNDPPEILQSASNRSWHLLQCEIQQHNTHKDILTPDKTIYYAETMVISFLVDIRMVRNLLEITTCKLASVAIEDVDLRGNHVSFDFRHRVVGLMPRIRAARERLWPVDSSTACM